MCFLGGSSVPSKATVLGLPLLSLLQTSSAVPLSEVHQNAFAPIMCTATGWARILIKSKQGHRHSLRHQLRPSLHTLGVWRHHSWWDRNGSPAGFSVACQGPHRMTGHSEVNDSATSPLWLCAQLLHKACKPLISIQSHLPWPSWHGRAKASLVTPGLWGGKAGPVPAAAGNQPTPGQNGLLSSRIFALIHSV